MSWTEQQIQMLKDMWGHGFSASEIAARLGSGLSRNAVIGKAHRLKLSAGIASSRASSGAVRAPQGMDGMVPVIKSTRKRVMLRPLPVLPLPPTTTIKKLSTKVATAGMRPIDSAVRRSEGVAVTKAGERQCRWPVGDPRSPDFRFCGCQVYETMPYCIDHARVAYQNIGKKHRAAEIADIQADARTAGR